MPRSSSGTRKVARSLATAMSAGVAISRPPAWQMPFTAATTGARLSRTARKGRMSSPARPDGTDSRPGFGPAPEITTRCEHVAGAR